MNEKLEQFKKEEPELFNPDTGEFYTGTAISPRQCELMRDAILSLEQERDELERERNEQEQSALLNLDELTTLKEAVNGYWTEIEAKGSIEKLKHFKSQMLTISRP